MGLHCHSHEIGIMVVVLTSWGGCDYIREHMQFVSHSAWKVVRAQSLMTLLHSNERLVASLQIMLQKPTWRKTFLNFQSIRHWYNWWAAQPTCESPWGSHTWASLYSAQAQCSRAWLFWKHHQSFSKLAVGFCPFLLVGQVDCCWSRHQLWGFPC